MKFHQAMADFHGGDCKRPGPGDYMLVLAANGEELGREPFSARLPATVKQ
jgi:hypothetical protein